MSISIFNALLCYMLINSFTPGPGNILALNTTSNFGWRKGKFLIYGICLGYLSVQFICTLAIFSLVSYISSLLTILKYVGGAYICYLSWQIIKSKSPSIEEQNKPTFLMGFLLQFVNVKIYFYSMTLLSVYLVPYFSSLTELFIVGIGVVCVGSLATCVWAFCGTKMEIIYKKHYRIINLGLGLSLLYCAWDIVGN